MTTKFFPLGSVLMFLVFEAGISCGPPTRDADPSGAIDRARDGGEVRRPVETLDAGAAGPADATTALVPISDAEASVVFHAKPFDPSEFRQSGGPDWGVYTTKRLPAITEDGSLVFVAYVEETGIATIPNLTIQAMRTADESIARTIPLLTKKEFLEAQEGTDGGRLSATETVRSYERLERKVRERIDRTNIELARLALRPLVECKSDHQTNRTTGAQSMNCAGTQIAYRHAQQRLDATFEGRSLRFGRPGWKVKAPIATEIGRPVPLKTAFESMWIDPTHGVLVGDLGSTCETAGDWCYVPSAWHVLRLSEAPK